MTDSEALVAVERCLSVLERPTDDPHLAARAAAEVMQLVPYLVAALKARHQSEECDGRT